MLSCTDETTNPLLPKFGEATAEELVAAMTLDEKIAEMHGTGAALDLFETAPNDRLGIPGLKMVDGPRGVRAGRATAFPVAAFWLLYGGLGLPVVETSNWGGLLVTLVVAAICFIPQLAAWKIVYGAYQMPQGEAYTRWGTPMIPEVLWSARNGWFVTTPVAYLAVIGLLLVPRKHRLVGAGLIAAVVVQVYLNSVIMDWWGQAAYGQRRLCSVTLPLVVGLTALLAACGRLVARVRWRPPTRLDRLSPRPLDERAQWRSPNESTGACARSRCPETAPSSARASGRSTTSPASERASWCGCCSPSAANPLAVARPTRASGITQPICCAAPKPR